MHVARTAWRTLPHQASAAISLTICGSTPALAHRQAIEAAVTSQSLIASEVEEAEARPAGSPGVIRLVVGAWLAIAAVLSLVAAIADPSSLFTTVALGAPYGAVGSMLAVRRPRNPIGWLFLGVMTVWVISASSDALGGAAVKAGAALPDGIALWLIWAASWIFLAFFALLFALTVIFPSGKLPGQRWGLLVKVALAVPVVGLVVSAFGPDLIGPYAPDSLGRPLHNPAGLLPIPTDIWLPFYLATAVLILGGVVSLVVRLARSAGLERQQLKWFVAALVLTAVLIVVALAVILVEPEAGTGPWIIAVAGYIAIPLAVGIAVLRYRLYQIDVVIRRSLVYAPLTALLAGLYAATVGILQRVFQVATGGTSDGAVVMGTLLIVAAFTPLRNELQSRVDRAFRDHRDLDRRLTSFVESVEHSIARPDPGRAVREFLDLAVREVGAVGGAAFVGAPLEETLVARVGHPGGGVTTSIFIGTSAEGLGRLDLETSQKRVLRDADLKSLRTAATALAAALEDLAP